MPCFMLKHFVYYILERRVCSETLNLPLSLETSILDPSIVIFIESAGFIIQYIEN